MRYERVYLFTPRGYYQVLRFIHQLSRDDDTPPRHCFGGCFGVDQLPYKSYKHIGGSIYPQPFFLQNMGVGQREHPWLKTKCEQKSVFHYYFLFK